MSLEPRNALHPTIKNLIRELQGLKQTLSASGALAAGVNILFPNLIAEDTIISAIDNSSGADTDILADVTIINGNAIGSVTCNSFNAADEVIVNSLTYTAVAGTPANNTEFDQSGDVAAEALSLAAAITSRDSANVTAVSDLTDTVNLVAVVVGTAGNAFTIAESTSTIRATVSGATFAEGRGVKPFGTLTCASVIVGDTVTVRGHKYTGVAVVDFQTAKFDTFSIGANNNECATNLAASINGREGSKGDVITATVASAVVTVTHSEMSIKGNTVTLTQTGGTISLSAATLTGGLEAGGAVRSVNSTTKVTLLWFDKQPVV